jgi:hypothetical protein
VGEELGDPVRKSALRFLKSVIAGVITLYFSAIIIEFREITELGVSAQSSVTRSSLVPFLAIIQIIDVVILYRSQSRALEHTRRLTSVELRFSETIFNCKRFTEGCTYLIEAVQGCLMDEFKIKSADVVMAVRTNPTTEKDDYLAEAFVMLSGKFQCISSDRIDSPFAFFSELESYRFLDNEGYFKNGLVTFIGNSTLYTLDSHPENRKLPIFIVRIKGTPGVYVSDMTLQSIENISKVFANFVLQLSDTKATESFVSAEILKTFRVNRLSGLRPGMTKTLKRFVTFVDIARYTTLTELLGPRLMA